MRLRKIVLAVMFATFGAFAAFADDDLPDASDLADAAAKRFPQPVLVGDLLNRTVLQPLESQPRLGRVRELVKTSDGTIDVVMDYGGFFGFFTRPIAVPVDAMALLGQYMEVLEYEPEQLEKFPTFNAAGTEPLPPDRIIRVALVKPSH